MNQILTIVGARPQFIKASVVSKALLENGIQEEIIHTGQHYDAKMSQVFFDELGIPEPVANLEVGSGHHGAQTAVMLEKIETYIMSKNRYPKFLMVYGDTNSTLAGALAASKLHIPVIHVEAGLRSFNREMPEEINRVVTDHISTILFCSSQTGVKQLASEGITNGVYDCGDVMFDAVQCFLEIARNKQQMVEKPLRYILMTVHRPSNTDNPKHLEAILNAVAAIDRTVIWPVHPRTQKTLSSLKTPENLKLIHPQSYFEMLLMISDADCVLTDSGGLQKEAYWLKKRCITLREETEWIETLEGKWNQLTGPDTQAILEAFDQKPETSWKPLYGDGNASLKIAGIISEKLKS